MIAGTALGLLNGGLNGVLGNGCHNGWNTGCSENNLVNRYELTQENRIAKLESEIALRDANIYNDQKMLELYKYIDGKFDEERIYIGSIIKELTDERLKNSIYLLKLHLSLCKMDGKMSILQSVEHLCRGRN